MTALCWSVVHFGALRLTGKTVTVQSSCTFCHHDVFTILFQWGIDVKIYSPGGANAIAVYDTASNRLTSAFKQNRNNYFIFKF